jgi:superfamily II DNA or RNA helicase
MSFAVGSLVKARGREWVVLPESDEQLLVLRPLGGTEDEVTGIYLPLERVESARFELPDPAFVGDYRSCRLLRDAVRLGFRSSAGPFRSFGHIAVEPRPYQLVPLLMALKLDPVRLLIADDVGIGKTIEACLVVRELIDRGEVSRFAVLCPPQLAEQWQAELQEKFHLDAELVLSSTAARLERDCRLGQSLFERYPYVVVSTDFIKADRRRDEFLRTCPELVIVDEAHTCAYGSQGRGGRHQRFQLVSSLAHDTSRHLLLVTATPHSGNEEAFRSLLTLLDEDFASLPEDLTGREHEAERRRLAAYFVQRRRGDIRTYLQADTPFPERLESEQTYRLSPDYKRLIDKVMRYARETVTDPADGNRHRQRVRWWSALALLRSMSSSPAAAAATLRSRASAADTETVEEADEIGRHTVLDLIDNDASEGTDMVPGSDFEDEGAGNQRTRRRLLDMAREADALKGAQDEKLQKAIKLVESLIKDGFSPIVFCRFIPTAEYVAGALRERLGKNVQVDAVTGLLPPAERENRIMQLAESPQRVLVCTDCLSEGINLQEHFNAVVHYDLSWNPTRHEQREGRVDRYGQPTSQVRVVTYYGTDNQVDGIVLDVLIRKHRAIRSSLGVSVPVPVDTEQLIEAIFEGLLLRENAGSAQSAQMLLPGLEDIWRGEQVRDDLFQQWEAVAEREKRSRTMFAQETIKVDEVASELRAVQQAIGSGVDVASFTKQAFGTQGAVVSSSADGAVQVDLAEAPRALRDALGSYSVRTRFMARFELPVRDKELYLNRTHPVVEGLASYVMDTALDPLGRESAARRCGVIRTSRVSRRTTLLLVRLRFHILTQRGAEEQQLLAEDCQVLAFAGSPRNAEWITGDEVIESFLTAQAEANVTPDEARHFLAPVLDDVGQLQEHLDTLARERGEELLSAHRRVRAASQARGVRYRVEPQLPLDVLGIYMYLPRL